MGVYIKGTEMPKKGQVIVIDSTGQVWTTDWPTRGYFRNDKAKAVPVPPHGDLIDRDVLATFRELVTTDVPGGKLNREYVSMAAVRNVKTIIPKEEGET